MMFDLSGMTALVTGASGGLGSAIAKAFASQGARLAVSGSNVEKLETFRGELGGDHVALPCNLSDGAAVDQLVPLAVEALGGKLDILINNAGVTRDNLLMRMKDEEFVELGGKVLGSMVKRIVPDAKVTSVVTIEDIEALAKEIA